MTAVSERARTMAGSVAMIALGRTGAAMRAIVLYKTVKSGVELGAALVVAMLWPFGLPSLLHRLELALHRHVTSAWALSLARWLEQSGTDRSVELGLVALLADGMLTGVEAWALWRGRWWAPWLVVVATGSLLPLELYELARSPELSRLMLLAANAVTVAYLARRARRERAARAAQQSR